MVLTEVGIPWLLDLMNSCEEQLVNATQYTLQVILNSLTGMDIKLEKKPDRHLLEGWCLFFPVCIFTGLSEACNVPYFITFYHDSLNLCILLSQLNLVKDSIVLVCLCVCM